MNEFIGPAIYLILALAIVAGIRAILAARPEKKPPHPVAAAGHGQKAQQQHPGGEYRHALPWIIPTALAPAGNKTISERLEIIESRVDRIVRYLAGGQLTPGPSPSAPPSHPAGHPASIPTSAIATPSSRAGGAAGH